MAMRLLDLFSGIGGFSYAAETLIGGYETVAFCEMDEFCQKVLKKHWPQVPIYDDVRTLDAARLGRIDICTFGFPCQPVSQAGVQKGESDDRWLWDEIIRILQVSKPKYIIAENVKGLISIEDGLLIEKCLFDLEDEGYEVQPIIIPACAKNAPHRRDRVWIIGQLTTNTNDTGNRTSKSYVDQEQQTIEQGWKEQSLFEPDRHNTDATNTKSKGLAHSNEREICIPKQSGMDSNEEKNRSKVWSKPTRRNKLSGENVADTKRKSINNTDSGWNNRLEKEEQETRTTDGSSSGQDVSNANSYRSETSSSRSVEQRVGDMADGLSRGLLRHFDREPEHIPRVTTEEKDRAKKLKALGNSIVPQVAAEILLAIRVSEGEENGSN
jgi:DNA (cytosine-5)-methyltransferase 1